MKLNVKSGFAVVAMILVAMWLVPRLVFGPMHSTRYWRAEDHLRDHQEELGDDLRALVLEHHPGAGRVGLSVEELPASLAVPGLRFAELYRDHVRLVMYVNPDTDSGFRVWLEDPPDEYVDRSTGIPFVFAYSYIDDYPPSRTNHP